MLPRVKRAQRAQPVESVADIETAPEGRRLVATGGASAASATRGQRRPNENRPGGAEETPGAPGASAAPCPPRVSSAPPGRPLTRAPAPRVALTLRVRSTRGYNPAPLRGGSTIRATFHGWRCAFGSAPPVATTLRPSGRKAPGMEPRSTPGRPNQIQRSKPHAPETKAPRV